MKLKYLKIGFRDRIKEFKKKNMMLENIVAILNFNSLTLKS